MTMTNQDVAEAQGKTGLGKIVSGILSGIISSYLINQASLHGVNFELLGVSSEIVKSSIDGLLIGIFVGLTPTHLIASICDVIVWWKASWRKILAAYNSN